MNAILIFIIALTSLISCAKADHFLMFDLSLMRRYAITDQLGEHLFVMAPKQSNGETLPHGTAYSIEVDGTMKTMWSVSGWYEEPKNMFLDKTGRYLVRITEPSELNFPTEYSTLREKIVLSFYDKGRLTKTYKFKDIVKDASKGVSNGLLRDNTFVFTRPFGQSPKIASAETINSVEMPEVVDRRSVQVFLLETLEGRVFAFDVSSGKMVGENRFKLPYTGE